MVLFLLMVFKAEKEELRGVEEENRRIEGSQIAHWVHIRG